MDCAQPANGGEQAERPALCRLDQPGIGRGHRRNIAALDVGDDQHFGLIGVIERPLRFEQGGLPAIEMQRAGAGERALPLASALQRRRGDDHAMGGFEHGFGKGAGGIEPAAVQADIIFAPLEPVDRQPVDMIGIDRAADAAKQREPAGNQVGTPTERGNRPFDPRTRRAVHPVRAIFEHCFQSLAQPHQRADQRFERGGGCQRGIDQRAIGFGQFGFERIAGLAFAAILGAGIDKTAHGCEQGLDRSEGFARENALEPVVTRERLRGMAGGLDRFGPFAVIAGDIGQAGGEATAAAA